MNSLKTDHANKFKMLVDALKKGGECKKKVEN